MRQQTNRPIDPSCCECLSKHSVVRYFPPNVIHDTDKTWRTYELSTVLPYWYVICVRVHAILSIVLLIVFVPIVVVLHDNCIWDFSLRRIKNHTPTKKTKVCHSLNSKMRIDKNGWSSWTPFDKDGSQGYSVTFGSSSLRQRMTSDHVEEKRVPASFEFRRTLLEVINQLANKFSLQQQKQELNQDNRSFVDQCYHCTVGLLFLKGNMP